MIYNRAAQNRSPLRHPVIVIPGILGTKLNHPGSETIVWGAFGGGSINPEKPAGARLLGLPMGEDRRLVDLRDDVQTDGALERVRVSLFGLPMTLNAYVHILSTLGAAGYLDEQLALAKAVDYGDDHYSCFQFDYDWRRDNVENAQRLHAFILEKKAQVQVEIERRFGVKDHDVKFDIVAHSMGGLITRYYLRYGDADLPNDGSPPRVTWGRGATREPGDLGRHAQRGVDQRAESTGARHRVRRVPAPRGPGDPRDHAVDLPTPAAQPTPRGHGRRQSTTRD